MKRAIIVIVLALGVFGALLYGGSSAIQLMELRHDLIDLAIAADKAEGAAVVDVRGTPLLQFTENLMSRTETVRKSAVIALACLIVSAATALTIARASKRTTEPSPAGDVLRAAPE
ncbi:hypothetical protein ACFLQU_04475, partial [Verrucomicrobiota bacterium]